jgi:hypothetical protein
VGRDWWQLPGPARFVEGVVAGLREGKNVVVCLPEHSPAGLRDAVADGWNSDEWPLVSFAVDPSPRESPVQQLFSRYVSDQLPDGIRNAVMLAKEAGFAGRVVWLTGLTREVWPEWKRFLTEYGYACNGLSPFERTLFCAPVTGAPGEDPPPEDVCLAAHRLSGFVTGLDILLHTHRVFEGRPMPDLLKRTAVAVTAKVSMWDAETSERLGAEKVERILDPLPVLREIAAERGWSGEDLPWHTGARDVFEGAERMHSAALAAANGAGVLGPGREVLRRVWSAQVGIVLPFVEELRQEVLDRLKPALRLPFTTRFNEVITDLRDLELGHIESQMGQRPAAFPGDLRELVPRLRKVRNCLAHHDPLTADMLTGIGGAS